MCDASHGQPDPCRARPAFKPKFHGAQATRAAPKEGPPRKRRGCVGALSLRDVQEPTSHPPLRSPKRTFAISPPHVGLPRPAGAPHLRTLHCTPPIASPSPPLPLPSSCSLYLLLRFRHDRAGESHDTPGNERKQEPGARRLLGNVVLASSESGNVF